MDKDRFELGLRKRKATLGAEYVEKNLEAADHFSRPFQEAMTEWCWGFGWGDDTIDAKLSDGEYVMDAETVALLGDGSTKAGAERLDAMREQLRKQKGRQLAKGKFSPNAKSPLAYLKGAM